LFNSCDYYHPIDNTQKVNCPNCRNWAGKRERCSVKDKVVRNDNTDLMHEEVPKPQPRGVIVPQPENIK